MKLFVYEYISAGGMGPHVSPSLGEEGWAMLSALVQDFDKVKNVETLTLLERSKNKLGRHCQYTSHEEEPTHFKEMVERADQILLIAPECDGILAKRSRLVLDAGKPLLGSLPAAIELTGDKWAMARHFADHQVPTPLPTEILGNGSDALPFPMVCKPRHGAGSQATYLVHDENELTYARAKARTELPSQDLIGQPFAPGVPASITFLIGPNQMLALVPGEQQLSREGRFHYLGGRWPLPQPLAQRAQVLGRKAIGTVEGLFGLVGVDLVLGHVEDGSGDFVIEINPRPTTSYIGLRQLAEENLADLFLRVVGGEKETSVRWHTSPYQFSLNGVYA